MLGRRPPVVGRHDDTAGPQRCVHDLHVKIAVGCKDRDAVARLHTERGDAASQSCYTVQGFGPGASPIAGHGRGTFWVDLRRAAQGLGQLHIHGSISYSNSESLGVENSFRCERKRIVPCLVSERVGHAAGLDARPKALMRWLKTPCCVIDWFASRLRPKRPGRFGEHSGDRHW